MQLSTNDPERRLGLDQRERLVEAFPDGIWFR